MRDSCLRDQFGNVNKVIVDIRSEEYRYFLAVSEYLAIRQVMLLNLLLDRDDECRCEVIDQHVLTLRPYVLKAALC